MVDQRKLFTLILSEFISALHLVGHVMKGNSVPDSFPPELLKNVFDHLQKMKECKERCNKNPFLLKQLQQKNILKQQQLLIKLR